MRRMYTPSEIKTRNSIKNVIIAALILLTTLHIVQSYKEKTLLEDSGYSKLIDVGDYKLNVSMVGKHDAEYRIVGISGLRHGDFAISASKMAETLSDTNQVVFIDRAGYGLSEDTLQTLTVAKVVEDYRTALQVSGIRAPYVLLAEHYGGVYATYWEACYPSEIEAVIFFDGTEMHESEEESRNQDNHLYIADAVMSVAAKIGLSRIFQSEAFPHYPLDYSQDEQAMGEGLTVKTLDSLAPVFEMKNQWNNIEATYSEVTRNTIPKLYITSDERWIHKAPTPSATGHDFGDPVRLTVKGPSDTLTPYLDQMGNCRLTYLGGVGHLYEYNPETCGQIIKSFLNNLEYYKKMAVN